MANHWYGKTTSAQQGLIIDEETGRNVAVVYDAADKDLIADAPATLDAARAMLAALRAIAKEYTVDDSDSTMAAIRDAITAAEAAGITPEG